MTKEMHLDERMIREATAAIAGAREKVMRLRVEGAETPAQDKSLTVVVKMLELAESAMGLVPVGRAQAGASCAAPCTRASVPVAPEEEGAS